MSGSVPQPSEVLLIDQEDQDIAVLRKAVMQSRFGNLHVLGDAEEALEYLHHEGPHADSPRPGLIVIDASSAEQHGLEFLCDVMTDQALHSIPVIVLVSGEQEAIPSYLGGHWSIVQRPLDPDNIGALLDSLGQEVFQA